MVGEVLVKINRTLRGSTSPGHMRLVLLLQLIFVMGVVVVVDVEGWSRQPRAVEEAQEEAGLEEVGLVEDQEEAGLEEDQVEVSSDDMV